MAVRAGFAFAAGVVAGWGMRSAVGSTREAVVQAVVLTQAARDRVRRVIAEQREWVEDLVAEGKARYELGHKPADTPRDVPPKVVDVRKRRGHAA